MRDRRVKRDAIPNPRIPSPLESRSHLQQLQPVLHNSRIHQDAWHDQNLQVFYQHHQLQQHQHQNLGVSEQFDSYEGLTGSDEFGIPYHLVQWQTPEVPVATRQNIQDPHTFLSNQSPSSAHNYHRDLLAYGGVPHNQRQLTHNPSNYNQQLASHGIRDQHGLGFRNEQDSAEEVLGDESSNLSLTARRTATERLEDCLFQKHSREHVKVMIELGNRKRIKHPCDPINQQDSLPKSKLGLDIISDHHHVYVKPTELQQIKTLPLSETLQRDATLGGYIFLCKDETMDLEIVNRLFVLPARYKDSVRAITPGIPLFLYNVTRHELHGIFEATSFGTYNTNPLAFLSQSDNDKFPAQVACRIRKRYHPLAEEEFRYALSHYDGPKFILQLSVPQVLDIITLFEEQQIPPPMRQYGPFSYCHRSLESR